MDPQAKAKQAAKQLNLDWDAIANIYLIGSRLWGTFTAQSDFDLLIVLKSTASNKKHLKNTTTATKNKKVAHNNNNSASHSEEVTGSHRVVHAGQFDALLYDEELYIQRIKQYSFLEMITLWIPAANIWKQEIDPRTCWVQINQGPHATQLWTSTSEMIERDMRIAQKHFEKGSKDRAARVIGCTLRVAQFAADIAEHGHVLDFQAANDMISALYQGLEQHDWNTWRDTWRQTLRAHLQRLQTRCETILGRPMQ